MEDTQLPINIAYWLLALSPILILLLLLVVFRWQAPEAGPVGMFVAAAIAFFAYQAPWETMAVAGAKGVWDAIFILYVVWPALLLYRITQRAGAFESLRRGIETFTSNSLFLVLAFGWVFASFLQGIAGFGTPIAVVAPLLIAIGVRPIYAVAIPLIGHAWANMFGTLAVGWLATISVIDLQNATETAFQTAIMLWVPNILAGFTIAWLFAGMAGIRHALPMILIVTVVHGGVQLGLTLWDPVLSNFLAATAAMALLYPLARWKRYGEAADDLDGSRVMKDGGGSDADEPAGEGSAGQQDEKQQDEPVMGLWLAFFPYVVLTVATVIGLVIGPVEAFLEQFEVGFPFPAVDTGYGVAEEAEEPYSPFAPLTHPGTFLLIACAASWALYRSKGFYKEHGGRQEESGGILAGVAGDAIPASVAVVAFLVMSTLMDHSGQTEVLALGIAEIAPPTVFAFAANWIGVVGAFMTSSNTASNILFAPLQQETAAALEGLQESTIIAAQSTGGAIGNAIAPANVVLGTGTAGIVGREGEVLRKTLPWALATAAIVGGLTILLNQMTFTG
jgi:lactate permease